MTPDEHTRFLELLRSFDHAMLITRANRDELHVRPMRIAGTASDGTIYFLTPWKKHTVDEILAFPEAHVTMQGRDAYLAVCGRCRIRRDEALIAKLWSGELRSWLDGEQDVAAAIEFHPEAAEYWSQGRFERLRHLWATDRRRWTHGTMSSESYGV